MVRAFIAVLVVLIAFCLGSLAAAQDIAITASSLDHHDSQIFGEYDYLSWSCSGDTGDPATTYFLMARVWPLGGGMHDANLGTVSGTFTRSTQAQAGGWDGDFAHDETGYELEFYLAERVWSWWYLDYIPGPEIVSDREIEIH